MTEPIIIAIVGALTTITLALITLLKVGGVQTQVTGIHSALNSRLDEWKEETRLAAIAAATAAYAKGIKDERDLNVVKSGLEKTARSEGIEQEKAKH